MWVRPAYRGQCCVWLGTGRPRKPCLISHRGKRLFPPHKKRPDRFWLPRVNVYTAYQAVSHGIKRQGRDADHLALSSDEVKKLRNTGAQPPLIHMPSWRAQLTVVFSCNAYDTQRKVGTDTTQLMFRRYGERSCFHTLKYSPNARVK